jgi:hypothetical protein
MRPAGASAGSGMGGRGRALAALHSHPHPRPPSPRPRLPRRRYHITLPASISVADIPAEAVQIVKSKSTYALTTESLLSLNE